MSEVKAVIGILCKHLNLLFNLDLKPEYFRLAKFNKNEDNVVPILWNVLSKFSNETNSQNTVKNTKLHLRKLHYECIQFFGTAENMKSGSRELLLALGFTIAVGSVHNIINQEIQKSPFNPKHNSKDNFLLGNKEFSEEDFFSLEDFTISNEADVQNIIEWIQGRICCNERMCSDYEMQIEKLATKISTTLPSVKKSLSMTHILALKNTECGSKFLYDTERLINILKNHDSWLKKENIFWEWMDSVLMERDSHPSEINVPDLESFLSYAKPQK